MKSATALPCFRISPSCTCDEIGNDLATLTNLTQLHLDFAGFSQIRSIDAIGKGLKKLTKLTKLHVNFWICYISSIDEIGYGLATLANLTELHLDFAGFSQIMSIDEVAKLHCTLRHGAQRVVPRLLEQHRGAPAAAGADARPISSRSWIRTSRK